MTFAEVAKQCGQAESEAQALLEDALDAVNAEAEDDRNWQTALEHCEAAAAAIWLRIKLASVKFKDDLSAEGGQ